MPETSFSPNEDRVTKQDDSLDKEEATTSS